MDMATQHPDQGLFHLTGQHTGAGFSAVDIGSLRPALLAAYRDLDRLRHDFPVVLLEAPGEDGFAVSLSTVVNRLALELAPRGVEGERLRRHLLRLEHEIRSAVAAGAQGELSALWAEAAARLGAEAQARADVAAGPVLAQAAESLQLDGIVAGCDAQLPAQLITQAWRHAQQRKAGEFRAMVDTLMRGLSDIRRAAWAHSQAGRKPQALRAAVGGSHAEIFDFAAMSRLVARGAPKDELPPARRQRIEWALSTLSNQVFYPSLHGGATDPVPAGFAFDSCAAAMEAFRSRLPKVAELVKAIAVAELEVAGRYVESEHDPVFDHYDEHALTAEDLSLLPDTLVCIPPEHNDAPENAALLDMLSSAMPVKVLVQVSDLLEEASIGAGHFAFGVRSARLATTAMGLGGMFVMQCASSALYAQRERIARGLACRGPALFTVFAGSPAPAAGLPPYLSAAAAVESRAFPTFSYDAAAGGNWAERFSLQGNRAPEDDWPSEPFEYADEALQRVVEPVRFTYADFALCDRRHAGHFAAVPRDRWHDGMLPVADWLALDEGSAARRVPYLLAVDAEDRLHRVLVDAKLMQATRRCQLLWRRLQEHAGIHDSHAERLLAQKRTERAAAPAAEAAAATAAPAPVTSAPAAAAPTAAEAPAERPPSDEAWIETSRCPSCNECQLINDRMFAYNDNKQAYIKDIDAGTYRQLVEAAESCQVAIIHPGKPRNPNEPGLAELMARAQAFL